MLNHNFLLYVYVIFHLASPAFFSHALGKRDPLCPLVPPGVQGSVTGLGPCSETHAAGSAADTANALLALGASHLRPTETAT